MSSDELVAPAKLTLSLRITGVRADGYHLIDAEMVSLALCDVLKIEESDTTSVTASGPFATGVPTDSSNIVAKALALVGQTARVEITKNIPHGGGLGGGSSDAAAILRWAGFSDLAAASGIGADVPYCVVGKRSRVQGIGEIVTPLAPLQPQPITLIIPPVNVPTPLVYAKWDEMGGPTGVGLNDLEDAACSAVPQLAQWRDRLKSIGLQPQLAGSGATWFVHGHQDLKQQLPDAVVRLTTTID